jgi:autophagy-related protein 17
LRPESEESKTLFSFVDISGPEILTSQLRASIDAIQDAQSAYQASNSSFSKDLATIRDAIQISRSPKSSSLSLSSSSFHHLKSFRDNPLPSLLASLEAHAREMASLLQSLVANYDLCVTALKHTEGWSSAAVTSQISTEDLAGIETSLGDGVPAEPISEEERVEMLEVLARDAAEVDDVVLEIRERLGEMEEQSAALHAHVSAMSSTQYSVRSAYELLEQVGAHLPSYMGASQLFVSRWEEEREKITEGMDSLESLRTFYAGFSSAYDGLIVEVTRRRTVRQRTDKVVREALRVVEQLQEEDEGARAAFRSSQGEFLPADIWPGLTAESRVGWKWERDGEEEVPRLPRELIEGAVRRLDEAARKVRD